MKGERRRMKKERCDISSFFVIFVLYVVDLVLVSFLHNRRSL